MASANLRPMLWIGVQRHKLSLSERFTVGRAPHLVQTSLHAHTREWSGNPAALGRYALRPVALRPRLSNGFAFMSVPS